MRKQWKLVVGMVVGMGLTSGAAFGGTIIDLTTVGSSGTVNGGYFLQTSPQPTGTGYFNPFVRIQNTGTEKGYNTDARPVQFDTKDENQWTHSIRLSDVSTTRYKGKDYRVFLLDINEGGNTTLSKLSLDQVQIFVSNTSGSLNNYPNLGTLVWQLDTPTADNRVELNYKLNHGSGSGDMFLYVPVSAFTGYTNPYVYLYSEFGTPNGSDAGFEEWSSKGPVVAAITPVPLPTTAMGAFVLLAAWVGGRRMSFSRGHALSPAQLR